MPFVMDASVTLAWCFEDETTPYSEKVLERLGDDEAVVPAIWPYEVTNVLLVGERRGRLTEAKAQRFLELLAALPISVDPVEFGRIQRTIWALARAQNLSSYDAAYLELAMRKGLPLATCDNRLLEAVSRAEVVLFDRS